MGRNERSPGIAVAHHGCHVGRVRHSETWNRKHSPRRDGEGIIQAGCGFAAVTDRNARFFHILAYNSMHDDSVRA